MDVFLVDFYVDHLILDVFSRFTQADFQLIMINSRHVRRNEKACVFCSFFFLSSGRKENQKRWESLA